VKEGRCPERCHLVELDEKLFREEIDAIEKSAN
jgi:hypothetical protein